MNGKQPMVDIITRSKDRILLLRRAMASALDQTFQDWRMVIVNDGGNREEVEKLVREHEGRFQGRCRLIHNPTSLGMEAASNRGITASDSPYLVIHDDDDSWHPTFLEECLTFLEAKAYPSVGGVITHSTKIVERIDREKVIVERQEPYNSWVLSVHIARMIVENMFPPISFLYKRSVLDEIGGYDEQLPVLGDWEFNLRFLEKYDIYVIPKALANYHHRLSTSELKYGNSIIRDINKHVVYDTLLRNRLLRRDMAAGRIGMGYLVNFGRSVLELQGHMNYLKVQSPRGLVQKAGKALGRICSKVIR